MPWRIEGGIPRCAQNDAEARQRRAGRLPPRRVAFTATNVSALRPNLPYLSFRFRILFVTDVANPLWSVNDRTLVECSGSFATKIFSSEVPVHSQTRTDQFPHLRSPGRTRLAHSGSFQKMALQPSQLSRELQRLLGRHQSLLRRLAPPQRPFCPQRRLLHR